MRNIVEEIKDHISIGEVVSSYVKLEKAGLNFRARCPFHNEKTPSFFVSPSKNTFHCFGCGKGGDIFTFVELIEGIDFKDAMFKLAEKAGVEISKIKKEDSGIRKKILDINKEASLFFEQNLTTNKTALGYLNLRGIKQNTLKYFQIGFSPDGWDNCLVFLKSKGFSESDILASGLSSKTQKGSVIDRFRSRIMFPLFDISGSVIGFSSRIFPPDKEGPKYLNSPETNVFHKSRFLYGFNFARQEILKTGKVFLTEGQMDLIILHQSGIKNSLAISGTALTEDHLKIIKRFTENIVFCFDSDDAGRKATLRAFSLSFENGLSPSAVILPKGLDPADIGSKNPDDLLKIFEETFSPIEWIIKTSVVDPKSKNFISVLKSEVLPILNKISYSIEKNLSIKNIAEMLDIKEENIWEDLKNFEVESKTEKAETSLVRESSVLEIVYNKILGLLLVLKEKDASFTNKIKNLIKEKTELSVDDSIGELEKKKKDNLVFQAEFFAQEEDEQKKMVEELAENLELEYLNIKFNEEMKKIRENEKKGNSVEENMENLIEITDRINSLKKNKFFNN